MRVHFIINVGESTNVQLFIIAGVSFASLSVQVIDRQCSCQCEHFLHVCVVVSVLCFPYGFYCVFYVSLGVRSAMARTRVTVITGLGHRCITRDGYTWMRLNDRSGWETSPLYMFGS